jgi:hypothetical protein
MCGHGIALRSTAPCRIKQIQCKAAMAPESSPQLLAPAALTQKAPPRPASIVLGLFAVSFALCVLVYLGLTASGPWVGGPAPRQWTAGEFRLARETWQLGKEGLAVLAPDATGTVVISVRTSLLSS